MADTKKNPGSAFGIGSVKDFFDSFTAAALSQTEADIRMTEKVVKENEAVAESAARYNQAAQASLEEQQKIEADRAEAARLAEGNIFERISLIGAQTLNPRAYTREGRTARTAELSQGLAFHGQVHNVQVTASEAKVAQAKAENALETLGINTATTKIRAQVEALNLAQQGLQASETMRALALSQEALPVIQKALIGPVGSGGKITIGGFEFSPLELRERAKAMETREQLSYLSPQATDPDFAQKLRVSHSMQLQTMNLPELEKLKADGYILPNGQQVEAGVWDVAYNRQQSLYVDDLNKRIAEQQITNQVPERIKAAQAFLSATESQAVPGSALSIARTKYLTAVGAVAGIAKEDDLPQAKLLQLNELNKAEADYQKAIESEALKKANGDKKIGSIYSRQMMGQPVSTDEIGEVMREKYLNYSSFGEMIPMQISNSIRNRADKILQSRRMATAKDFMSAGDKTPDKEMREQAFNEAFEFERHNIGTNAVNQLQKNMTQRTDHPAVQLKYVPQMIASIDQQASQLAMNQVATQYNLTPAQMEYLKNGDSVSAGIKPEQAAEIAMAVNRQTAMATYELYEKARPGLGAEVLTWYQRELPIAAEQLKQKMSPMERDMMGDSLNIQADLQRQNFQDADKASLEKGQQQMIELAAGAKKPENAWLLMLNMSDRLENPQKQSLYYDVILPAVKQARAENMDDQRTSAYVFEVLNSYQSNDPTLMNAIKSIQKELPSLLNNFETTWAATLMMAVPGRIYAQRVTKDPALANDELKKVIPWVK